MLYEKLILEKEYILKFINIFNSGEYTMDSISPTSDGGFVLHKGDTDLFHYSSFASKQIWYGYARAYKKPPIDVDLYLSDEDYRFQIDTCMDIKLIMCSLLPFVYRDEQSLFLGICPNTALDIRLEYYRELLGE